MTVQPKKVSLNDPLATVNHGNMGIVFRFKTSRDIFVSAQFLGTQTDSICGPERLAEDRNRGSLLGAH
jgi:hypothetical protein